MPYTCHAHDGLISDIQTEALSVTSVRRTLLRFERAVNKNQDQRSKYPDKPEK
jgi:beta-catenin-like protein 1